MKRLYYPELDGLRFIAFLLVFIHHSPMPDIVVLKSVSDFGWLGVDIFFSLSAFLFTKLLHQEYCRTGTVNIRFFFIRRALRIWPAYAIYCAAMILLASRRAVEFPTWRAVGLLTFSDNIFAACSGYNQIAYCGHLWTISYEEQFYLLMPAISSLLFRWSAARMTVLLSVVALIFVSVRALLIHSGVPHPAVWVLPVTHFESILFGIILGLGGFDSILARTPVVVLVIAGMLLSWCLTEFGAIGIIDWRLMFTYPLTGLSASLIVYFVLRTGGSRWMNWIRSKPLLFLGKISYGLYLYHVLLIRIGRAAADRHSPTNASACFELLVVFGTLLCVTALAAASYVMIEKPFLKFKSRFEIVTSRPV